MYSIGYDIGSSSIKIALIEISSGKKVALHQEPSEEMEIQAPQKNWAEQDPDLWWTHICNGTKKIIAQSQIDASQVTTVGIAYQMHGLVIVNKEGSPLRDAIIWCDSRAVAIGQSAYENLGHNWCAQNLLNSPGNFTASKLKWVKENEPGIYQKIWKYMLPGDYIAYKLTGNLLTTKNGLSEATLWNYKTNNVATELLDYYGVCHTLTPQIIDNFTHQGKVTKEAAITTGLTTNAAVRYRSGDQPNNALALNILKPGEVAATAGTSGVVYAVTDANEFTEIEKVNHFAHVNYTDNDALIGRLLNLNSCGIQYRWLKENFNEQSYEQMNEKASTIPLGSEGLILLPFGNGAERIFNNKIIDSHICNLNLNIHTAAHLFRAALEGIAFAFVYGIELLRKDKTQIKVLRAGNDNLFRSEIFATTIATLTDLDIEIYNTNGALGAARAALVQNGDFTEFRKLSSQNSHKSTYKPAKDHKAYVRAYKAWKEELDKKLDQL